MSVTDNKRPVIFFADAKTCVFWDVEDYPIPDGIDPASFYQNIKEAIKKQGYHGEVSIQAYVDKSSLDDELRRKYEDAGFNIEFVPQGYARFVTILLDLMFWAFENNPKPTNIIVLAKNIEDDMGYRLESMYGRGHGLLVSQTDPDWDLPSESSTWFLTSLFDGPSGSSQRLDNKKQRTNPREEI